MSFRSLAAFITSLRVYLSEVISSPSGACNILRSSWTRFSLRLVSSCLRTIRPSAPHTWPVHRVHRLLNTSSVRGGGLRSDVVQHPKWFSQDLNITPVIVWLSFVSCVQVSMETEIFVKLKYTRRLCHYNNRNYGASRSSARVARRKLFGNGWTYRQTAIVSLLKKTFTSRSTALGASRLTRARVSGVSKRDNDTLSIIARPYYNALYCFPTLTRRSKATRSGRLVRGIFNRAGADTTRLQIRKRKQPWESARPQAWARYNRDYSKLAFCRDVSRTRKKTPVLRTWPFLYVK